MDGITAVLKFNCLCCLTQKNRMPLEVTYNTAHCSSLLPLMIAFQLKLFLNSDVQSLSGQALILLTQL